tara:strand:+ start:6283 stop:6516 length:234 start_codon:yes stop_codon:yes gene_type:complete
MKKIILIIFIIFGSSSLYASEMNKLLEQNYKIIKTELIKFNQDAQKIFTLKNGKNIFICSVQIEDIGGLIRSECIKP